MRRPVALLLLLLTTVLAGCRTSPRRDLVEAELRVKDQDLRELRADLERSEAYNQFLQREIKTGGGVPPEVSVPAGMRSLTLGNQTAGIDDDGLPGDEALQVVLEPKDADGHIVKVPGTVNIQALEVTVEGTKKPLSSWQVDPETLRKSWRSGLLRTGYFLMLPWQTWPSSTKVRVVVQFVGQDERMFEADRDVTIRLAPETQRKTAPMPPPGDGPVLPSLPREGDILPSPRKVEPEKKQDETTLTPTSEDLNHPLRGAVEMLKPIIRED
jgi:hypothetical protein